MIAFAVLFSLALGLTGLCLIVALRQRNAAKGERNTRQANGLVSALSHAAGGCLDPCILTDANGIILYVSESALARLGFASSALLGSRVHNLAVSPEEMETTWRLMEVLERKSRVFQVELRSVPGKPLIVSMTISRLVDSESSVILVTFTPLAPDGAKCFPCATGERLRSLLDQAPVAIFEADRMGVLSYYNRRFAELHGLPARIPPAFSLAETVHPEDREFVTALWSGAFGDRAEFNTEYRILRADGCNRWVRAHAGFCGATCSSGGKMLGAVCDETSNHAALSEAKSTATLMEAILASTPVAVVAFDREARVIVWNPAAEALFGYSATEVLGRPYPLADPSDQPEFEKLCASVLDGESLIGRRITRSTKSRNRIELSLYASPMMDERGNVRGVAACLMDITSQTEIERELRRSTRELRRSQEIANLGSWLMDLTPEAGHKHGALSWSSQTYRIFGVDEASFHGTLDSFLAFVHPDDRQPLLETSKAAIATGKEYRFEHRIIRPDGETRIVRERALIEFSPEGRPSHMVGTIQDVTEQRRMEQRFAQADRMEGIGRLAGGIAHDFNNLLTVINGYADLVLEAFADNEDIHRPVREIRKAGTRAADLTNQLLTFSRRQVSQPRVVDLNAVIEDSARMLGRVIGEDIDLTLELTPGLHPIWIDPGQLNQVIMNLAINARDAMQCGGRLTIRTRPHRAAADCSDRADNHDSGIVLEVEDTGEGIDENVLPHIFEPFYTTKEQGRGTGLGLSMVYGIIEQAGGDISVSSTLRCGTTFTLRLPAATQPDEFCRDDSQIQQAVSGGSETILIVEDQREVLDIAALALRSRGYNVLESMSPGSALSVCSNHDGPIHLFLTDIVLPEMTGLELAQLLTARRPEARVIYMSGYAIEAIAQRGILPQSMEYLAKPFSVKEVQRRVRRVLDSASPCAPVELSR